MATKQSMEQSELPASPVAKSALEVGNYELKSWLKQSKLESYYPELMKTGYDDLEHIKVMTPEMLSELMNDAKINLKGHRIRMMSAVKFLQSVSLNPSVKGLPKETKNNKGPR